MSKVRLISITPECEKIISYCARVSSPNQENPEYEKLLKYCIKNGHWSVFEMGHLTIEITTSRGVSPQILRHRSMNFQEFSLRYSEANSYEEYEARRQDDKNRQNSIDDLSEDTKTWFKEKQAELNNLAFTAYKEALDKGIAKECARTLLTLGTTTKMYVSGNIRSWIHYISLRTGNGTQAEHKEIAENCKEIFKEQLPIIAKALEW